VAQPSGRGPRAAHVPQRRGVRLRLRADAAGRRRGTAKRAASWKTPPNPHMQGGVGSGSECESPKLGWVLLRDPQAGINADVLAVLANTALSRDQEVTWAASRRLPEEALRSWEYPSVPLH
jgi:hypothetical protein